MNISRPILRYRGGKFRLAPWILQFFPAHEAYVEPFGGAASILLLKERVTSECYNDIDGQVVNVLRVLRDERQSAELRRRLALTAFAREELDWSYGEAADPVDAAHRMIVRSFLGHGSDAATRACRAGFRNRFVGNAAVDWSGYPDQVPAFSSRLSGVMIEQGQAPDVIKRLDGPQTLFYVDPPAPADPEDSRSHAQRHSMTAEQHAELAQLLHQVRGMVVLSGSPQESSFDHYMGWDRFLLQRQVEGGDRRAPAVVGRLSRGVHGGNRGGQRRGVRPGAR